jgi:hypothetical protein
MHLHLKVVARINPTSFTCSWADFTRLRIELPQNVQQYFLDFLFLDKKRSKTFKKQQKSHQFDKGFRMVFKLSLLNEKIFWPIFCINPDQKK